MREIDDESNRLVLFKTYIMAGAMELFVAGHDVRDFVIITPGRTILDKTRDNFTPGHAKSLLGTMSFRPVVITSDNFATPAMRAAMDDASQVKEAYAKPGLSQASAQVRRLRQGCFA